MAQITKKMVMEAWTYFNKMKNKTYELEGKTGYVLWKALTKNAKKYYRDTLHEYFNQFEYPFDRIFNDSGMDGFTAYIILPSYVKSREDAKEYYEEVLEEHCLPSAYDCTGQRFNYLLAVQKCSNGRYGVYVRYCYDF